MFSNLELEQQLNHLEVLIVNRHQQRGPAWVTRLKTKPAFKLNTYIKRLGMSGLTTKRVNAVNVDQARLLL